MAFSKNKRARAKEKPRNNPPAPATTPYSMPALLSISDNSSDDEDRKPAAKRAKKVASFDSDTLDIGNNMSDSDMDISDDKDGMSIELVTDQSSYEEQEGFDEPLPLGLLNFKCCFTHSVPTF